MKVHTWIRRISLGAVISFAGAPLVAIAATDHGTLTVGRHFIGVPTCYFTGYYGSGSYSPTGLTGGKTVTGLFENGCNDVALYSDLRISGFSSDPGQSWLTSITCNGITNSAASAFSFLYSDGVARWIWPPTGFGFHNAPIGTNHDCSITHK